MSMVTYYNSAVMYSHQQAVAQNAQFHSGSPMHAWYTSAGYHHQGSQMNAAPAPSYCMQEEQQMWQHHPHAHSVFHNDFPEYMMHAGMPLQQQHHQNMKQEVQLPSPPITVSGSDMSSPGAGNGNITPPQTQTRPPPVRSPYEWIKKTSYQTQPTPAIESPASLLLDYPAQDLQTGKTRTKDKYRVVYTDHQRLELEKEFTFNNPYITIKRKAELAATLGLSERQIKIWFQNRRAKQRKQAKKRNEEKSQLENTTNNGTQCQYPQNILHHNIHNQQMQHMIGHNQLLSAQSIIPSPLPVRLDERNSPSIDAHLA